MRSCGLVLIAIGLAATATTATGQPLEKAVSQQNGGVPFIELISWDCNWTGAKTVIVNGEVKNISSSIQRNLRPYVVVRNLNKRALAQSTKKTLNVSALEPEQRSTFDATMTVANDADVPSSCELDFTDANSNFIPWRESSR